MRPNLAAVALPVNRFRQRPLLAPAEPLQVRNLLQPAHGSQAEPRDRPNAVRDAEQVAQEVLAVERDPADTEALGSRGQPEVLDREAGRVQARVGDRVPTQHRRTTATRVVGDHDAERGLQDPLDLDPPEGLCPLAVELRGEDLTLAGDVLLEGPTGGLALDKDEVPRLAVTDARRRVRCCQDAVQHLVVELLPGEFGADIAAARDRVVQLHVGAEGIEPPTYSL